MVAACAAAAAACLCRLQGTDGRGVIRNYSSSSDNCLKMLPAGWENWTAPAPPQGSSAAAATPGQLSVRFLPSTLRAVGGDGVEVAPSSVQAPSALQRIANCPPRVHYHSVHKNLTTWANPTCKGAGLEAHMKRMEQQRRAAAARRRQCNIAVEHPGGKKNNTGRVVSKLGPAACAVRSTPRAELDARDAAARLAARRVGPALEQPGDFSSKLERLVQAICFDQGKGGCDVDYDGSHDWYKKYFSVRAGWTGLGAVPRPGAPTCVCLALPHTPCLT